MCKYCMPSNNQPIGQRHVQINKMILNTANCLGSNSLLIQICLVQVAGLLFGRLLKITVCIIIDIYWGKKHFKLKGKMMCRYYTQAWNPSSLKAINMKRNIYLISFNLQLKLPINAYRIITLRNIKKYLRLKGYNRSLNLICLGLKKYGQD